MPSIPQSKHTDWLNGQRNKIHSCAVYKKLTSALKEGTMSTREGEEEKHGTQKDWEASSRGSPRLQTRLTKGRRVFGPTQGNN